jgi:hypothetical protein
VITYVAGVCGSLRVFGQPETLRSLFLILNLGDGRIPAIPRKHPQKEFAASLGLQPPPVRKPTPKERNSKMAKQASIHLADGVRLDAANAHRLARDARDAIGREDARFFTTSDERWNWVRPMPRKPGKGSARFARDVVKAMGDGFLAYAYDRQTAVLQSLELTSVGVGEHLNCAAVSHNISPCARSALWLMAGCDLLVISDHAAARALERLAIPGPSRRDPRPTVPLAAAAEANLTARRRHRAAAIRRQAAGAAALPVGPASDPYRPDGGGPASGIPQRGPLPRAVQLLSQPPKFGVAVFTDEQRTAAARLLEPSTADTTDARSNHGRL